MRRMILLTSILALVASVGILTVTQIVYGRVKDKNNKFNRDIILEVRENLEPQLPLEIKNHIIKKLSQIENKDFPGTSYRVGSVRIESNHGLIFIESLDGPNSDPNFAGSGSSGKLMLAIPTGNEHNWRLYMEGEEQFDKELDKVPDKVIDDKSKVKYKNHVKKLNSSFTKAANASNTINYSFPWEEGQTWLWGRSSDPWHGWHCTNGDKTHCAIDFGTSSENKKLVAAEGGTVTVMCSEASSSTKTVNIRIIDDSNTRIEYFHIKKPTQKVKTGQTIEKGDILGEVWEGDLSKDCEAGVAFQNDSYGHVHLVIPKTPITFDGWTFDYPSKCATKGANTMCSNRPGGAYFTSSNIQNGNCIPPDYGEWEIKTDIVCTESLTVPNDIRILNDSSLALENGASFNFDLIHNKIMISPNGKLTITSNSKIY